jgi:predicted membrane protein
MKGWRVFWGILFVLVAVLLILDALGIITPYVSIFGEITFWQIAGGLFFLSGAISLISNGQFWTAFVPLGFIFMIFERNIAFACGIENGDIINNWLLFGCTLLLSAGFMFLIPKKKKKNHLKICVNGREKNKSSIGHSEKYVDCATFDEVSFENNLGALEIRFENVEMYRGGGELDIENNLGATEIYIPSTWRLKTDIDSSLGSVEIIGEASEDENAPLITITGDNNLGSIEINIQ